MHCFFGFDRMLGYPYFFKIADYLRKLCCEVYTPAVSATNTPEERDEQLLAEVRKILRKSGAEKVNLIGHC